MNAIEPLEIPQRSTITSSIPSFTEFPVPMAGTGVTTTSVQRLASDALAN